MAHATLRRPLRNAYTTPTILGPKAATVRSILNFSKALKMVEVPPIGKVGIVLN